MKPHTPLSPEQGIEKAIKIAGTQRKLAAGTGFGQNAIWKALNGKLKTGVTAGMALAIHTYTKGRVKKSDLCPAAFPPRKRKAA